MFKSSLRPKIEKILGHVVLDSEMSTIDDLRCLGAEKIVELKALAESDEYLSILYLKYIATKRNEEHVTGFVYDVIVGNEIASSWYKNIIIVGNHDFTELAKMEHVREILTLLVPFSLQAGFSQIEFDVERWKRGSPYATGAPCVVLTDYDYRIKFNSDIMDFSTKYVSVKRIDNAEVAALRWLVSRLASMIWYYLTDSMRTESDLLELLQKVVPNEKFNNAIRSAVAALMQEMNFLGGYYTDNNPPGFVISDESLCQILRRN